MFCLPQPRRFQRSAPRQRTTWLFALCGALCLLAACGSSGGATVQKTPTTPVTPTATAPAVATALVTYTGHTGPAIGAAWSPDSTRLASCGNDGTVQVWNAKTGHAVWKTKVTGYTFAVAWSPDGKRIAVGGSGGPFLLDAATGHTLVDYSNLPAAQSGFVEGLAWSPDSTLIASGSEDGTVVVWDTTAAGKALVTYSGHSDSVERVAWSPDGTHIASASYDKTVQIWNAKTGQHILTYSGHQQPVWSVAWSPDGTRIASGTGAAGSHYPVTSGNSVQVWDATTGKTLVTYAGGSDQSYALAWSPDGAHIVSGAGHSARVWDSATGQTLLQFTGHHQDIFTAAWSPDGTLIATASADGTVQVWRPQV